ncbi:Cysteine-rich receptor-like protein kinase 8 [Acorus calamus]|uniref:non-specific serine/threonine protein kinase n=1 Tax=Acorus calamus TaxID=4465 RepID=A0AAV9FKV2_ACOCL|nr:Cysteine-rich receptor-like protein kinase 8 [Acorus calamus]
MGSSLLLSLLLTTTLLVSLSITTTRADPLYQICQNRSNYTTNSTYQSNLNTLLRSLSSNGPPTGFFTTTQGNPPDQVDGLVLCRGDTNVSACAACLDIAVVDVVQSCPTQKGAVIWYDDCLLRYSNIRFFNSVETSTKVYMWNVKNATDPRPFFAAVYGLMGSLVNKAAGGPGMFATGEVAVRGAGAVAGQKVYGLAQCTRDLSRDSCAQCLGDANNSYSSCTQCAGKVGGRVIGSSCNIRFEIYKFYGNSSIRTAVPSPSLPPIPPPTTVALQGSKKHGLRTALTIIIPVVTFVVIVTVVFACLRKMRRVKNTRIDYGDVNQIEDIEPQVFDLAMLRNATNNFSDMNKLGEGGFGVVYKGTLADGLEIAVKRLSRTSSQGLQELRNEVVLVVRLQHRNLVRLLGCCLEDQEKLLIYEYVPNKSLNTFLFDPVKVKELTWERRYKIIEGIARGILYLHEESQLRIIHRDLKVSNVLLDKDMNPKISDFGLARLFGMDQTQDNTSRVVGTYGYMAPEYAMRGHYSIKSDVFSFGVLVLEIITGLRNSSFDLLSHVWKYWNEGRVLELIDQLVGDYSSSEAMRCVHIGLLCVQEDAGDRPTMSSVVLMLSSLSTSLTVPFAPAFFVGYSNVDGEKNTLNTPDRSTTTTSNPVSTNDVSITELEPR